MKTLYDKIWDSHVVVPETDAPAILYIDMHLIHEVTTPQAFTGLKQRGLRVRCTDKTFATMDHSIPTTSRSLSGFDEMAANQVRTLADNCAEFGIPLFDLNSPRQGIVHVIGPELGLTQPGRTIVCGDSHTSTHGAFGALAHGIGTSEVEMVLATQCLLQRKSQNFLVNFDGRLQPGVTAKDMILGLIGRLGTGGGTGSVFEFAGSAIRALDMAARMTICNVAIEGGARVGLIAPDDTTFQYLAGREFAPKGQAWADALVRWKKLPSDEGAHFDKSITIDVSSLEPMITYGTNPAMSIPISGRVPKPETDADAAALKYMALEPGQALAGQDRKSTRLNSSHEWISYAVFCLKKKNTLSQRAHASLTDVAWTLTVAGDLFRYTQRFVAPQSSRRPSTDLAMDARVSSTYVGNCD